MNFRFPTLVVFLIGLLVFNGILLSKFVQHYFLNAQKELNKTDVKFFAESKSSLPKADIEDVNNVRLSDENGFIRLKRSIDSSPKESNSANVTNSNFSISQFKKPVPVKNLFSWNLNLNVSKYVNSSNSQEEIKSAGLTKINHQSSGNYLNLSIHLDGGPNNEDVFDAWTSVGKFIKDLFKTESSIKVSDFDQNKEHQFDPEKLNIDEMSPNKDETLGSLSSDSYSELPKISDKVEVFESSTENMEENEFTSKQKEGKFLYELFGFGASQSAKTSTEIDVDNGILRSGPDVSDLINVSEHFTDLSKVDEIEQSTIKREHIDLANALMIGIQETPSEEKSITQSSILVSDIDSFQNLPNPTASVETMTNTDISFIVEDIPNEKLCSDCDSIDEVTDRSVIDTKSTIMKEMVEEIPHEKLCLDCNSNAEVTDHSSDTKRTTMKEMAVFDSNIPQEHETSKPLSTEDTSLQSEHNISLFGIFDKASENINSVMSSTESGTNMEPHPISEFESKLQILTREELCADCSSTDSFQQIIPDNDNHGPTAKTDIDPNTDGSQILMQEVFNVDNCSECIASENVQFSSGVENIAAQNITATNLTEADLEKNCMKLIDVLANARNALTEVSGGNSTVTQLNESQLELFKFLTDLINFILANQRPSNESIAEAENTSHELTSNETESNNKVRVFSFDLGASTDEKSETGSNFEDLSEVGTENPNSALLAECDAFIRRKQIKENNKMFSKPNLMDIISDPNIGVHDFANATISPKLKESQLQFLTDLLRGNKKEQSSTAETGSEAPFVVEDEPNNNLSNVNNIERGSEEIVTIEEPKVQLNQENTDGETSELSNTEDKTKRFFLAGILNSVGLGSGERSFNEIENLPNGTEFQGIEESKINSDDRTEMTEKSERFLSNFEFETRTEGDVSLHSKIETSTLVGTDEIVAEENEGRFFLGLLGFEGSGGGRNLDQTDDLQVGKIDNKIHLSSTESEFEGLTGVTFENETVLSVENRDSECLEDCNSAKVLNIKVNADRNSEFLTTDTLIANHNLEHLDSDIKNEDARNFKDLDESSHSEFKTTEFDLPTPINEDFDGKVSQSIDEFSAGVDHFKNDTTENAEKRTNFPDPRLSRRRGRLDDFHEPSLISGREPKHFDFEDEVKFLTSPISEDGSWMDPLQKGNFSKTELQTEQIESRRYHEPSGLRNRTQVINGTKLLKPFEIFAGIISLNQSCKSASECSVSLNERCITVDNRSICACGRSFFRNHQSLVCEAKVLVETSFRLPEEDYSDELSDPSTERYKKMKEDSIYLMWYLLAHNLDIYHMVADVDVLGFSPGSLVIHWSLILHSANETLKKIHDIVETHLNETIQNEADMKDAPLNARSAELIQLPMMDPCQYREFNYCSEKGYCVRTDMEGGYKCECDTNMVDVSVNKKYAGELCEEKCPSNFCGPNGVCQWQDDRRMCLCSSHYFGKKCESSVVVWVSVSTVLVIVLIVGVNLAMYFCRRMAKRLRRSQSGGSATRLEEVIAMDELPVHPQRYADIATPRPPEPEIRVTHASCSSISFDGDSTFDTTNSDVGATGGAATNTTFIY